MVFLTATDCMPISARMPMEKIRMPSSASISTTPSCLAGNWMRFTRFSSARTRVGGVGHRRVAHAHRSARADDDAQAAHRTRRALAGAAAGIAEIDGHGVVADQAAG